MKRTARMARSAGKLLAAVGAAGLAASSASAGYIGPAYLKVACPRLRLEFAGDGSMKGYLGGYRDWREYIAYAFINSGYENTISYNSAGMYQAIRRAADGLYNKETGEFDGISSALELEGVAAFIPPEQRVALLEQR